MLLLHTLKAFDVLISVKYVCYGNGIWDPEKWVDVKTGEWIKPRTGGLWSSPVDSEWGWIDWCKAEDFHTELLENSPHFTFSLSQSSKVYNIDTPADLRRFKYSHLNFDSSFPRFYIDFEEAAKEYDAIFLSATGESSTRWSDPYSLYGWDCETLLVLKKEVIINIENYERANKRI